MYKLAGLINRGVFQWTSRKTFSTEEQAQSHGQKLEQSGKLPIGTTSWSVILIDDVN
jgi:hypothetical protein